MDEVVRLWEGRRSRDTRAQYNLGIAASMAMAWM